MSRCPDTFEPVGLTFEEQRKTHTCAKEQGHDGAHMCPLCRMSWTHPLTPGGRDD